MSYYERKGFIVLGGGLYPDGSPTDQTLLRAEQSAEAYRLVKPDVVVFTGNSSWMDDNTSHNKTEAETMAYAGLVNGIPERKIVVEPLATSVIENFVYSRAWLLDCEGVTVITHAYMGFRALKVARHLLDTPSVDRIDVHGDETPWDYVHEAYARLATNALLRGVDQGDGLKLMKREQALKALVSRRKKTES